MGKRYKSENNAKHADVQCIALMIEICSSLQGDSIYVIYIVRSFFLCLCYELIRSQKSKMLRKGQVSEWENVINLKIMQNTRIYSVLP